MRREASSAEHLRRDVVEEMEVPAIDAHMVRRVNPKIIERYLSGTESAILNRESSDSESCDLNRVIPRSL